MNQKHYTATREQLRRTKIRNRILLGLAIALCLAIISTLPMSNNCWNPNTNTPINCQLLNGGK
jgi:hypothetical protein